MQPEPEQLIPAESRLQAFWEEHRGRIIAGVAVVAVAVVAVLAVRGRAAAKETAAQAALFAAEADADLRGVIERYGGTSGEVAARLLLADRLRSGGRYDEAEALLKEFVEKHPKHALAPVARLSWAEVLRLAGRTDEAAGLMAEVGADVASPVGPAAMAAQATLYRLGNRSGDARQAYESLIAQYPDSYFALQARQELQRLPR